MFSKDFWEAILRQAQIHYHEVNSRLRFNLLFATTLLHEVRYLTTVPTTTHASRSLMLWHFSTPIIQLEGHQGSVGRCDLSSAVQANRRKGLQEPRFLMQKEPEAGYVYQLYLFEWDVIPINGRIDCSQGLFLMSACSRRLITAIGLCLAPNPNPDDVPWHALPMTWVNWLQQESSWPDDYSFDTTFAHRVRLRYDACPAVSTTAQLTTLSRSQQRRRSK